MILTISNNVITCSCGTDYTLVGNSILDEQRCIFTTEASPFTPLELAASQVNYGNNIGTISSLTFRNYYVEAAAKCKFFSGTDSVRYCQILANLCVLQLYNNNAQVCVNHLENVISRGLSVVNDIENWVLGQPWIYFANNNAACQTNTYTNPVSLSNQLLEYVVAMYTLNGTFVGYNSLETLLSYCTQLPPNSGSGGGTGTSTKWQIFGTSQTLIQQCNLKGLLGQEQYFYELYLYDPSVPNSYSPVPIRIVNLLSNGVTVNKKDTKFLCDGTDVLVRRFFLYDIVSGLTSTTTLSSTLAVMRYASSITLETGLQTGRNSLIYPTVMTIEYSTVQPPALTAGTASDTSKVTINVYYTTDLSDFLSTLDGFLIAGVVVTGLLFLLRYYNWSTKNARVITQAQLTTNMGGINFKNIMEIIIIATNTWVLIFYPFTVIGSWYFFVFFKLQSTPSIMLPPQQDIYTSTSEYYPFVVNIHLMAFFQLFYVVVMIIRQCNSEIFFIDWEPAKPRSDGKSGQVSVWRSIMVANEFAEMQTLRRSDIKFTLFWIGFFLIGTNCKWYLLLR